LGFAILNSLNLILPQLPDAHEMDLQELNSWSYTSGKIFMYICTVWNHDFNINLNIKCRIVSMFVRIDVLVKQSI
jgi:hypothetical protein